MDTNKLKEKAASAMSKIAFSLKKASPDIFLFAGIGGVIGSTVLACIATVEAQKTVEKHKEVVKTIKEMHESSFDEEGVPAYSKEDLNHDIGVRYAKTAGELAVLYAPAVGLEIISLVAILASRKIMKDRNIGLAAAFAGLSQTFKEYQENVKKKYGEEVEQDIRHNVENRTYEETVIDENGKKKKVKKNVKVFNKDKMSPYAKFFTIGCTGWNPDSDYNEAFLKLQQDYATKTLRANGHLFLNEVYDMLGIPRTKEGQSFGWLYTKNNPNGENYVDFGMSKVTIEVHNKSTDLDDYEDAWLLDFNIDGYILDDVVYED